MLYSQTLKLAHGGCSINICWMMEWLSAHISVSFETATFTTESQNQLTPGRCDCFPFSTEEPKCYGKSNHFSLIALSCFCSYPDHLHLLEKVELQTPRITISLRRLYSIASEVFLKPIGKI